MRYTPPGHFKTVDAFATHLRELDPEALCSLSLRGADGPLGRPVQALGRTIGNRFAIHPMEGWDGTPGGLPTEHTLRRWRRFGRSGAKLIWGGEAYAVCFDGRANPGQLFLNDDVDAESGLRSLLQAVHDGHTESGAPTRDSVEDLVIGLQLTHSGRFARPDDGGPRPLIAHHHPVLDPRFSIAADTPLLSDDELARIGERFVAAAGLAERVGFHFVDVKCCHGYLLHELLAAHTRPGVYGGGFDNRTRLFREIVGGIRTACPDLGIACRVSITDLFPFAKNETTGIGEPRDVDRHRPYRHGFGVDPGSPTEMENDEPFRFLELLATLDIDLVNITLGSPYYCPHAQRPAAYPPSDGYLPPEDPLLGVMRHLRVVAECKRAFPAMVFVGSGYSYLQEYLPHVAEAEVEAGHVDIVGLGRMVLSYPELPRDVLHGREILTRQLCRTFSDCTTAPRHGLISGCYPLDDHYRALPQFAELRVIKKGLRR